MAEDARPAGPPPLPAGRFAAWLAQTQEALAGSADAAVPCAGCTACCRSAQFVTVEPDEADARAHIPRRLLAPAPGGGGRLVIGFDEEGRCPLLTDAGCSIYPHRPRACRTYDCRVFAAAGVLADPDRPLIAARARQWRFDPPDEADRRAEEAVRAAAGALRRRFPDAPAAAVAVMAVEISDSFADPRGDGAGGAGGAGETADQTLLTLLRRRPPRPGAKPSP
ncbi:MAG: YkgJ family cysteine cluster protein [Acidimicrobiales bacterium]